MRFKRKEINRLYKNQKILVNKVNDLKNDNLEIQSNYIDIVSSLKDMPPENVEEMLKARDEINKNKHVKVKVKSSKRVIRKEIRQELESENKGGLG